MKKVGRGGTRLLLYLLYRFGVRRYFEPVAMTECIALCGPVWCGVLLAAVAITIWVPSRSVVILLWAFGTSGYRP